MLSYTQRQKILINLKGKKLAMFFLWSVVFFVVNFYANELDELGMEIFEYKKSFYIPYLIFITINSLLIGLSFNLLISKMKEIRSMNPTGGFFSVVGTFVTLLTGACPGCVAGVFPMVMGVFGSHMTLYSLPFYGLELQVLSLVFLLFGIYFLSRDMSCKIKHK